MALSRDAILKAEDLKTEAVFVEEWGGEVRVRTLTAADRDRLEGEQAAAGDGPARFRNFRARVVARCAVDDEGKRLFTEEDVEALGAKSGKALDRVFEVAARMNGLTKDAQDDAEKNFDAGR